MCPPLAVRIGKRLGQLFQPGLGVPKHGLAVTDKQGVEVEVQEPAHAAPKASRVIHDAFRQQPAPAGWAADDRVADDQDPAVAPKQRHLAR